MIVREGHIHSAVPFIIFAAMLCTEHVFGATNSLEPPNIIKSPDIKSWTAIDGCTWVLGDFGAIFIAFLLEGVYQGNNSSRIGIRLVPMTGGGIICVQVFEFNHGAGAIKLLGVLDPVSFGLFDICKEVLAA